MSWIYSALTGSRPQSIQIGSSSSSSRNGPPPAYDGMLDRKQRIVTPLRLPSLDHLRGKRVVLGSASPRRKDLLAHLGLTNLEIIPSTFQEDLDKQLYTPYEYVLATATAKCEEVYKRATSTEPEPAVVISADTIIVTAQGQILEKPSSPVTHLQMLQLLRDGPPHKVYTAVVAMAPFDEVRHPGYAMETAVEETEVKFDKMVTDELLKSYVETGEGSDKAGGYALQGTGSILVEGITGPADNVVGLPLRATLRVLEKVLSEDEMDEDDGEEAAE